MIKTLMWDEQGLYGRAVARQGQLIYFTWKSYVQKTRIELHYSADVQIVGTSR